VTELLGDSGAFVVIGVMAAGKSTVAELLARRFARGVHLQGDVFRKMIVTGRDPISPGLRSEAIRQLELRQRLAANAANEYWRDGFTVVLQDIYIGQSLSQVVDRLHISPLYVIVLAPRADVIASREQHRGKRATGIGLSSNTIQTLGAKRLVSAFG
jgi:predicted kinase